MKSAINLILMFCATVVCGSSGFAQTPSECELEILNDKRFVVLKGKVDLLNSANQTTAILANTKVPSNLEKAAISDWIEGIKRCSAPGIEYHRKNSAEIASIFEKAYLDLYVSAADLYAGKISYGQFAQDSVRRHVSVREQISIVVANFKAQQAATAQRAAEVAQREAETTKQEQERRQNAKRENCFALQQSIDNLSRTNNAIAVEAQRITSANEAARQQKQLELSRMTPIQRSHYGMQEAGANLGAALMGGSQNPLAILDQQYRQNRQSLQSQQGTYQRECLGD